MILLFFLFAIFVFLIACIIGEMKQRAKKAAREILDGESYDPDELEGILKTLSSLRDNEGKRLYSKLADFADDHK